MRNLTKGSFDPSAVEITFGAIALDAAGGSGKPSSRVSLDGIVDCEGKLSVGACRDRSRLVVSHLQIITGSFHRPAGYPQRGECVRCANGDISGFGGIPEIISEAVEAQHISSWVERKPVRDQITCAPRGRAESGAPRVLPYGPRPSHTAGAVPVIAICADLTTPPSWVRGGDGSPYGLPSDIHPKLKAEVHGHIPPFEK